MTFEEWAEESQIPYRRVETIGDLWDYLEMAWKAGAASARQEDAILLERK